MALCDPYRMLARQLEGSFQTEVKPTQRVPLYLILGERALIIKALHNTAAPYATWEKAKPEGGDGA